MDRATPKFGHLNPYESPPQELRDIFKLWKGSSKESINQLNATFDGMQILGSIPTKRLETAFQNFTAVSNHAVTEPASIYGSADLPGRKFDCSFFNWVCQVAYFKYKLCPLASDIVLTTGRPFHPALIVASTYSERASFTIVASRFVRSKLQD